GLWDAECWPVCNDRREPTAAETQRLASTWVQPGSEVSQAFAERFNTPLTREYSLLDLLRRPEVDYRTLTGLTGSVDIPADAAEPLGLQTQYAGYIARRTGGAQDAVRRVQRASAACDRPAASARGHPPARGSG